MGLNWSQIDNTCETDFPTEYQEKQKLFNFWKSNKYELKQDGFIIKKDDETNTWKIIYNNNDLNIEEACSKWKESFDNFIEDNIENKSKYLQIQENQTNQAKLEDMIKKIVQDEVTDLKTLLLNELNEIKELLKQKNRKK